MNAYQPSAGLHVYFMGKRTAEQHERRCMGIPPHVGLGWTPYTILVRSHGGTLAHKAFHRVREFRQWLGGQYAVKLNKWSYKGFRGGQLVAR